LNQNINKLGNVLFYFNSSLISSTVTVGKFFKDFSREEEVKLSK